MAIHRMPSLKLDDEEERIVAEMKLRPYEFMLWAVSSKLKELKKEASEPVIVPDVIVAEESEKEVKEPKKEKKKVIKDGDVSKEDVDNGDGKGDETDSPAGK